MKSLWVVNPVVEKRLYEKHENYCSIYRGEDNAAIYKRAALLYIEGSTIMRKAKYAALCVFKAF